MTQSALTENAYLSSLMIGLSFRETLHFRVSVTMCLYKYFFFFVLSTSISKYV